MMTEQQAEAGQGHKETKRASDTFEQFGEQMANWGEEFGRQMEAWGKEFEQRMEAWGKEFGPRMEAWAEELAQHMEQVGQHVEQWLDERTTDRTTSDDNLREERLAILRMVEEGKIDAAEAESLLRALGE
jgi:DNA anti-recombination protein RmuC